MSVTVIGETSSANPALTTQGGTGSGAALNNNRKMISSGNAIVEGAELAVQSGSNIFFAPTIVPVSASANPLTGANVPQGFLFCLPLSMSLTSIIFEVTALNAGKFCGVSLYSADGNTRVADTGPISAGSTGIKTGALVGGPIAVPAGFYWIMVNTDATTLVTFRSTVPVVAYINLINQGTVFYGTAANAAVAGQNPTTLGAITANTSVPMLSYKLQG